MKKKQAFLHAQVVNGENATVCNGCVSVVQVIAIGPTTATSLKQVGIFPIMAHAPTPEALLVAVHQCFIKST